MTLRERMRRASFRGVPFHYDRIGGNVGRHSHRHDMPQRDLPYLEDLGRRGREFKVEGYLIGEDWPDQLAKLIAACEKRGPGLLVHPTLGEFTVFCSGGLEHEISQRRGRMVDVSMGFTETSAPLFPIRLAAPAGASALASDQLVAAATEDFTSKLAVAGVPESVRKAAADEVAKLGTTLKGLDLLKSKKKEAAELLARASKLVTQANSLILNPAGAAAEITGAVAKLLQAASNSRGALLGLRTLLGFTASKSGGSSTVAQLGDRNAAAVADLVVRAAAGNAVRAAAAVEWESKDEAIAQRDAIAARLDELAEDASLDDAVYQRMRDLRAVLDRTVPPANQRLPSLRIVTPPTTLPALVLAYGLYDDAAREMEIAERNNLPHPGFVRGGSPVEVLVDV